MTNELKDLILIFEDSDKEIFRSKVNFQLNKGYKLVVSNCSYDTNHSCPIYQAILFKES